MASGTANSGLWGESTVQSVIAQLRDDDPRRYFGSLKTCTSVQAEVQGLNGIAHLGDGCWFERNGENIMGEVIGLDGDHVKVAATEELSALTQGTRVWLDRHAHRIYPAQDWRGRVLDAMARPIDDKGPLRRGLHPYNIIAPPPRPQARGRLGPRLSLGVRAMDLFTPCCEGQRLGIFAGSGVGKSSLISMIASQSNADVIVVGLIGERGRELNEFLEETLGPRGLARSVVVAATSDTSAMMRRRAAYLTLTIAEYFRDQGKKVLCLLDSVTRFAMALREIYLAAGEPPTTKGYPPAVFAELPKLLERAGPMANAGTITALFSVLVEGDDTNEPVADTVRGILDGHIVMDRQFAERGRFPAIDVLRSVSRTAPNCYLEHERPLISQARELMQSYANMAELIELGAYKHGSNPALDRAIALQPGFEQLLRQDIHERVKGQDPFQALQALLRLIESDG